MIPRRAAALACLCLALGCSGESFKSEADELEYLSSLSQPSVRQFHRRKELQAKAAAVRLEAEAKAAMEAEKERQAYEKDAAAWKVVENAAKAKAALVEAEEFANRFVPGTPRAADHYRKLVADYPDSPEADVARDRIRELEGSR